MKKWVRDRFHSRRELYIEKEDFMENPPKKYFRLFPGNEVRLRGAYFVTCNEVIKDEQGNVIELHCTYDPETKSGSGFTARKVKGTIHWVEASTAIDAEVRLYDHLILEDENGETVINKDSLTSVNAKLEPSLGEVAPGDKFQFIRNGYFCRDIKDAKEGKLVFNRTVALKSSWKK